MFIVYFGNESICTVAVLNPTPIENQSVGTMLHSTAYPYTSCQVRSRKDPKRLMHQSQARYKQNLEFLMVIVSLPKPLKFPRTKLRNNSTPQCEYVRSFIRSNINLVLPNTPLESFLSTHIGSVQYA